MDGTSALCEREVHISCSESPNEAVDCQPGGNSTSDGENSTNITPLQHIPESSNELRPKIAVQKAHLTIRRGPHHRTSLTWCILHLPVSSVARFARADANLMPRRRSVSTSAIDAIDADVRPPTPPHALERVRTDGLGLCNVHAGSAFRSLRA